MENISEYIAHFLTPDNPQLEAIDRQAQARSDLQPSIGMEVGKLLGLLVRLTQAQRVLEFGTSLGYSTIWLAEALRETGGQLISIEYNEDLYQATRANLDAAGLTDWVELILGDAALVIDRLEGPFDLILQDADKALYPKLLEKCIRLTRLYGMIVADDALFQPMGVPERLSTPVHTYNQRVFSDPRLYSTILPIGDGVTVSIKVDH